MYRFFSTITALILVTSFATAATTTPSATPTPTPAATEDHPCQKLSEACGKAGFMPGAAKSNKGLVKNCLAILLKGGSVPGITASPMDIKACKAKREAFQAEQKQTDNSKTK